MKPLADLVRPTELDEVCGQEHILGKNKILDRIIKSGHISNMIFYGPPGTGKTTVANGFIFSPRLYVSIYISYHKN
jgi:putative ATPase